MGCYPPLGKMVSKALRKCKGGRKRHGVATTVVYTSPPTCSYARSVTKTVSFSDESPVVIVPPEPTHVVVPPISISKHHSEASVISPSPQAEVVQPEEQRRVRFGFAPGPGQPNEVSHPHPQPLTQVRFEAEPDHHDANYPYPTRKEPAAAHAPFERAASAYPGSGYRYTPSPLPRWEEGERRKEYFGGEYHYYPTPIREGIYRIATDENRLTTIFSEENPNACSII